MNPFAIATAGLSLAEGIFGASSARAAGRASMASIDEQMRIIEEQRYKLREAYTKQRGLITDTYGNKVQNLMSLVGNTLTDIGLESQSRLGQSGLAYVGGIDRREKLARKRVSNEYSGQQFSLYSRMQEDLMGSEMREASEIANLDVTTAQLRGERSIAEQQSKQRFLGIF